MLTPSSYIQWNRALWSASMQDKGAYRNEVSQELVNADNVSY
jgi:hypothetical protein